MSPSVTTHKPFDEGCRNLTMAYGGGGEGEGEGGEEKRLVDLRRSSLMASPQVTIKL